MSHFVGIVVGDNYEEQIEPFWELDLSPEDAQDDDRAEFECEIEEKDVRQKCQDILAEQIKTEKKETKQAISMLTLIKGGHYLGALAERWGKDNWKVKDLEESKDAEKIKKMALEDTQELLKKVMEEDTATKYMKAIAENKLEDILSEQYGGGFNDNGDWGYWHNPNAHWDWAVVGGRWTGFFKLKEGATGELGSPSWGNEKADTKGKADIAKVKDIDWEGMNAEYLARAKKWWKQYQDKVKKGEIKEGEGDYMTGVQAGDTKELYLAREGKFSPFCVVKDGEWYERGTMGWWGITTNEKGVDEWVEEWQKLILELDPEDTLTAVDFHI